MDGTLLALAALACPVGMGVMMWLMMRGQHNQGGHNSAGAQQQDPEIAELRSEVARLKADRAQRQSRAGEP